MSDDKQDTNTAKGDGKVESSGAQLKQDKKPVGKMVKQSTSKTKTDKQPPLFNAKPAPKMNIQKNRYKNKLLPVTAIFFSIIVLIGIAWSVYNQHQIQQEWKQLEANVNQQVGKQQKANNDNVQTTNQSLQTSQNNQSIINQQTQLVSQLRQALTATQEKVRELSGRRQQDWVLAEAAYLIKLAEYKITLQEDKYTAIELLKTADEKVVSIGDNNLLELRQALAQDIANLQLVVAPDVSGISVKINTLIKQISDLKIIALEFAPIDAKLKQKIEQQSVFSWHTIYQNFLDDFVTIKDHSQPVKPLMTLEHRGNLNANIQLALQQAQIALLRGEQSLYEMNLDNAMNWITEFFKLDEATEQLLQNLTQLRQLQVNIDLPKKLMAKKAIQSINQAHLYQWLQPSDENNVIQAVKNSELESQL